MGFDTFATGLTDGIISTVAALAADFQPYIIFVLALAAFGVLWRIFTSAMP